MEIKVTCRLNNLYGVNIVLSCTSHEVFLMQFDFLGLSTSSYSRIHKHSDVNINFVLKVHFYFCTFVHNKDKRIHFDWQARSYTYFKKT